MFQLFIVFHKKIFDECYADIPQDILSKYFTFIAVNKNIPKEYTPNKYNVINEWELPIYDNTFQERGYNENSAIYHVYANNLHKAHKYIGFFQYDMVLTMNHINFLLENILDIPTCFAISIHNFVYCSYMTWYEPFTLECIIDNYEAFYKKKFNRLRMYPLYNTYVLPTQQYEEVMEWVTQLYDKLYPWCVQPPNNSQIGHMGGIYERVMAYAVGNLALPYKILKDVSHDHSLKKQVY